MTTEGDGPVVQRDRSWADGYEAGRAESAQALEDARDALTTAQLEHAQTLAKYANYIQATQVILHALEAAQAMLSKTHEA